MSVQRVIPDTEEIREIRAIDARRAWKIAMARGKEWLDTEHSFVLLRGDASTGRTRKMLGREAKRLNREYEKKFIEALDANKAVRMYRWKWNDPIPEGKRYIARKKR